MATTNLVGEVTAALEHYCQDVQDALDAAAKEAAELTLRQVKANSPKGKSKKKKYNAGWSIKKREVANLVSYTVYNRNKPGLTHTLEHGHLARNQFGTFGRVRAIPHIGPAAEAGIQRFELSARARIRRIRAK